MQGAKGCLRYPIRRLVTTGEDTPSNYALLLGPARERETAALQRCVRVVVLASMRFGGQTVKDEDAGALWWRPRGASVEEIEWVERINELDLAMGGEK